VVAFLYDRYVARYIYGERSKRRIRQRVFRSLVVFISFLLGVAGTLAIVYTEKMPSGLAKIIKSINQVPADDTVGPIGMGRNAKIPKTTKDKNVEGAGVKSSLRLLACGSLPAKHANLSKASSGMLRKLAEYEQVCGGAVTGRVMFFTAMPGSTAEAKDYADWVAQVLGEFAKYGISPLVIFEPKSSTEAEYKAYQASSYEGVLNTYFDTIKKKGITDKKMGLWVPFPEANLPMWGTTDPDDFALNVTKTVQAQKKYFPGSKAAVLLESKTYPTWETGKSVSLLPYVKNIPKGLVNSFGLQGFAWPPTSAGDTPTLDPKSFLRTDFASEAANALGAKEIWFNTGTYDVSYILGRSKPQTLTAQQRQTVLNGVIAQAKGLKSKGYSVAVHIFAKDKSAVSEGIDWSYWDAGKLTGSSLSVFRTFVNDLNKAKIPLWLFDTNED
jgi:hypothetical protein